MLSSLFVICGSSTIRLPTFLVVGCQRCGTTWLDAALREHPEVFLPSAKQSYFFDQNFERGVDWWLQRFSEVMPEHRAVGEVATGYCLPDASARMAESAPDAKLIMTMRHPIERAYSNYLSRCAEQGWSSFEDALEREPDLVERGRYMVQIEGILKHYPREQILLLFYDDLAADNHEFLSSVLRFIGVDDTFESSEVGRTRNAAMLPGLRMALRRVGLGTVLGALSRSPFGDMVRKMNTHRKNTSRVRILPQTRARLVDEFQTCNNQLADFVDRDLSSWNR